MPLGEQAMARCKHPLLGHLSQGKQVFHEIERTAGANDVEKMLICLVVGVEDEVMHQCEVAAPLAAEVVAIDDCPSSNDLEQAA
jgi:hypothetical protein